MKRRRVPSDDRKSKPELRRFIDALRGAIDKDPLYDNHYRPDVERFYTRLPLLPAVPKPRPPVY